jgi:hypothetical protein
VQEASPSVVFIKDLVVAGPQGRGGGRVEEYDEEEEGSAAKVEGTGSGFVWDSAGHIVSVFLFPVLSELTRKSRGGISAVWTILLRWLLIQVDVDFYPDVVSDSCQFCRRARSTDLSIFAQGLKLLWF